MNKFENKYDVILKKQFGWSRTYYNKYVQRCTRNIPIILLTADHQGQESYVGEYKNWVSFQNQIASFPNKNKHIFANDSNHNIQIAHSQVVIDEIEVMVNEVR